MQLDAERVEEDRHLKNLPCDELRMVVAVMSGDSTGKAHLALSPRDIVKQKYHRLFLLMLNAVSVNIHLSSETVGEDTFPVLERNILSPMLWQQTKIIFFEVHITK